MAYTTLQGLIDRFGERELIELTDRTNIPVSTVDATVVARAIDDASALIDGYVAKVAALPLADVPPALEKVAADIARYYLHGKAADKDSPVTKAHDQALAYLRDVARGVVTLAIGGAAPAPAGGGSVQAVAPNRVFTRDSLRHF